MTATEIVDLMYAAIAREEEAAFAGTVEDGAAEGWANPTLRAQSEWQGHDNGIVLGTFADALSALVEFGEVPTGVRDYDAEDDGDPQHFLVNRLDSAGVIGDGAPLAYIGVDGYFTLICDGATREQIESAATDCLPGDYEPDEDAE
jgi:hypothetical protein